MVAKRTALFSAEDRKRAMLLSRLVWANPFSGERTGVERELLGLAGDGVLNEGEFAQLLCAARSILERVRPNLVESGGKQTEDFRLYQELVFFDLFHQLLDPMDAFISDAHERGTASRRVTFYDRYEKQVRHWLPAGFGLEFEGFEWDRLFAIFFQVRRAYYHIERYIVGGSPQARALRARVWQSVFTRDMQRYMRSLTERLSDVITLITGPSGTGKELVARGIGLSRFVPFRVSTREFAEDFVKAFYPVNLSALSNNLIESELFGHRKGAFTGAIHDRQGYLDTCGPYGTVFLDEIGETETTIQVKLLRVLQTRSFVPIGDTEPVTFRGKLMAATNRDLEEEIEQGRFREDFYYRLNADRVKTPSLHEILQTCPDELERLVAYVAGKIAGTEGAGLTDEVCSYIHKKMPEDYIWPGNFRELEQCVRNVLMHGEYHPRRRMTLPKGDWQKRFVAGDYTVEELLTAYITPLYRETPNYGELGRRLGLDPRTVKKYVQEDDV